MLRHNFMFRHGPARNLAGRASGNKIVSDNCAAAFATNDESILITIGYTRCAQAARAADYAAAIISCIILENDMIVDDSGNVGIIRKHQALAGALSEANAS
jgi:hypothetical protein